MSCVVKGCPNTRRFKPEGITFHQFPKGKLLNIWIQTLGLPDDWQWTRNKFICSKHFKESDFVRGSVRNRLKYNAVPCPSLQTASFRSSITESPSTSHQETGPAVVGNTFESTDSSSLSGISGVTPQEKHISTISESDTKRKKSKLTEPRIEESQIHTSTSTDSSTKRKRAKFVQTIHSYSISPGKIKKKYHTLKDSQAKARKKLYAAKKSIRSLQRKVTSLKSVVDDLRQRQVLSENALAHLEKSFEDVPHVLMSRYIKNANNRTVTREKYPEKLRDFAATLQFYSSKAYEYVRKTFALALPHQSVIRKWCANINCSPGFCDPAFEALKSKVEEAHSLSRQVICSLMLDEMAIRKQLEFDGNKVWGYIDYGTGIDNDDLQPATEALVLMVVSVNAHWKLPIAYFFITTLTGKEKANIIREALLRLAEAGVLIVSLTCDGPSVHFTMLKELGCALDDVHNMQTGFQHPSIDNSTIFCLLDVCHMLKLMRNLLASLGDIKDPNGGIISWSFIKKLHELQETETLNLANKLKKSHMEWQKQKMKVNLAAQTLSASVADALEFLGSDLHHPDFIGCEATVHFIRTIDKLFDLLNSKSPWATGFKAPLKVTNENTWRVFLQETCDYLLHCTDVGGRPLWCTPRKTPVLGFVISALSTMKIFDTFVKNGPLDYLLTYKCSQDHLEIFFSSVRSRNGWNNNPSCLQFMRTFKKLLLHTSIRGGVGNCKVLDSTTVLNISSALSQAATHQGPNYLDVSILRRYGMESLIQGPQDHDYDVLPIFVGLTGLSANVVTYISGFVVRMLKKQLKCPECILGCMTLKCDNTEYLFINKKNKGGLHVPTEGVVQICTFTEAFIRRILCMTSNKIPNEKDYMNTFVTAVSQKFYSNVDSIFPHLVDHFRNCSSTMDSHSAVLIKAVVSSYTRIRMFNLAKRYTATIQGPLVRRELNKLILFNHQ